MVVRAAVSVLALAAWASAQEFTPPDVDAGGPLAGVVFGDTNGDDVLDAYVDGLGGRRIVLGLPGGGFDAPRPAWAVQPPDVLARGRVLADVTGDGRDDLVMTIEAGFELLVAPALADGTFAPAVSTPLPSAVGGLDAADVDGDGRADVWYGEIIGSRARLLRSLGDATFVDGGTVSVPQRPIDLVLGDVTGDGLLDVVTLSIGPSLFETIPAVAAGLPGGGAAPAVPLDPPAERVQDIRLGDLTGDGVDDVALLTISTPFTPPNTPIGFFVEGGAGLARAPSTALPVGSAERWEVADVDADGLADLVLLETDVSRVLVRRQRGSLDFEEPIGVGVGAFVAADFAVVDADADGAVDVVTASTRGTLRLGAGRGDGTFAPARVTPLVAFRSLTRVGDLDGDGAPELVTAASTADGASIAIHAGRPGAWFGDPIVRTINAPVDAFELIDAEGDGDLDVVAWLSTVSGPSAKGIATILNQDGVFGFAIEQFFPGLPAGAPAFGDVTGDGLFDVTVFPSSAAGGDVLRFVGASPGFVDPNVVVLGTAPTNIVASVVGEVDGVAPLDVIALAPFVEGAPAVLTVTPAGVAAAGTPVDVDPRVVGAGDWTGDGLTDLVVGRFGTGFEVRVNDGAGGYVVSAFVGDTLPVGGFDARDVDGDGDVDVAVAERGLPNDGDFGRVSLWINDGDGCLEPGDVTVLDQIADDVVLADVDGDLLLDAVVSSGLDVAVLPNVDATWTPLGRSLAGPSGFARLDGVGPLVDEGDITIEVRRAEPFTTSMLVTGFSELAAPFAGGVLVPSPDVLVTGLVTNGVGGLELAAVLPQGAPPGVELFVQLWQGGAGSFSATTATRGVTR